MKLNKSKIFAIIIPLLLAANIAAFLRVRKSYDNLSASQKELANLTSEQKDLENLTVKKSEAENTADRISRELPKSETDVAQFLETLTSMAQSRSIGLESSVEDDVANQPKIGAVKVGLSLTVSGSYVGVTQYLSDVYNLPYYFSVSEVSVKPRLSGGVDARLRLGLFTQEVGHD